MAFVIGYFPAASHRQIEMDSKMTCESESMPKLAAVLLFPDFRPMHLIYIPAEYSDCGEEEDGF